jgi:hypothetical protein
MLHNEDFSAPAGAIGYVGQRRLYQCSFHTSSIRKDPYTSRELHSLILQQIALKYTFARHYGTYIVQ